MTTAAIYIYTYHHMSPEHVAEFGEPTITPLDVQERACRAYCERMGYKVFNVYTAMTKPPKNVERELVLSVPLSLEARDEKARAAAWESARFFYQYRVPRGTLHPYHFVQNLLESSTVDVIVGFMSSGPSRSLWADAPEDQAAKMPREELASLWEIEPPTEQERQLDELARHLSKTKTEEERRATLTEMEALAKEMEETVEGS